MSDRVTIPCTVPFDAHEHRGIRFREQLRDRVHRLRGVDDRERRVHHLAHRRVEQLRVSRLFADSDQSLTEPTQFAPSITGSCDTSCSDISRSAWRTVVPGRDAHDDRRVAVVARFVLEHDRRASCDPASSSWFSRIHSSLYSFER